MEIDLGSQCLGSSYLVLGGTGFIGRAFAKRILEEGGDVTVVSAKEVAADRRLNGATYLCADMSLDENIKDVFTLSYDYIVNTMGYVNHSIYSDEGKDVVNIHLISLLKQFEFINQIKLKKYLYIGSADEYADLSEVLSEAIRECPMTPYSYSKTAVVHFLQMLHRSEKLPTVSARVFLTYGPGQSEARLIPQLIASALKGEVIQTTPGEQVRDFCFIDDLIDGLLAVLHSPNTNGRVLNVASGTPVAVKQVVNAITEVLGGTAAFGARQYRKGESMHQVADTSKVYELTGWKAKIGLLEGISRTISDITSHAERN